MQGVSDLTRNLSAAGGRRESKKNSCLTEPETDSFMLRAVMEKTERKLNNLLPLQFTHE